MSEREAIFLLEQPTTAGMMTLTSRLEIFKTQSEGTPIEIHFSTSRGFKRERGGVLYLTPEMVRAIRNATDDMDPDFDTVCTRPQHSEGPCNGTPRSNCPGYENWVARESGA